jgi:peptide deformylase
VATLEILRIGEPVLRAVVQPVTADELGTPGFQRFLDDLVETMREASGAGLAAPQVGVSRRVFCVEVHSNPRYPYKPDLDLRVLVNPELRVLSDETFGSSSTASRTRAR